MKSEIVKARFIGVRNINNYRTTKNPIKPYPDVNNLSVGNIYTGTINMYNEFYIYHDDTGKPNLLLSNEYEIIYKSKYNKYYTLIKV